MDSRYGLAVDRMSRQQLAKHIGRCAREMRQSWGAGMTTRRHAVLLDELERCSGALLQMMAAEPSAWPPQRETLFAASTAYPVDR
jgi:hypothetical protein